MSTPTQQQAAPASSGAVPSILSYSRALQSEAKKKKKQYWMTEIVAALLSVGASVLPWVHVAAVLGVCSVVAKFTGKLVVSSSKRFFRAGERARRYDFYAKTLGWPVPPRARADMVVTQSSGSIEAAARKLAATESDYYAHKGSPGTERLLCNLAEAMFWTEKLMAAMAKNRWKEFALAGCCVVAVLVGTLVLQPSEGAFLILKYLGAAVALLVALDVLGEAQSFERGEREVERLLSAVITEMGRSLSSPDETSAREEGLRLLIEYNCLLADLPLLPDALYEKKKDVLNAAWSEYQESLPLKCTQPAT